ncbi:small subunit rRNA maturation protein TSR4 SCDLUD_003508 [Saccharomycodes ludwigii]|uniref:small subunit rRNA maturation protein TSR4 n=1 Tax=Saccharomycodes ludwigii TaxID=36035 RepID=UPI001E88C1F9|nr:hypothetical protein SCDLUD_003508 [Saccharomycodes ludwigii]KAH3900521.1 hypothetical protein SCDLUD_003508 [Saccharomycodes ludwigii]
MAGLDANMSKLNLKNDITETSNLYNHPEEDDTENIYEKGQSEVYLGFVDTSIKETDEVTIEDTFIGGEEIWLHPESKPDESLLKCGNCSKKMKLLLQAFTPLDTEQVDEASRKNKIQVTTKKFINGDDDRVLYVFICTDCPRHPKSVRCIRGVKKRGKTFHATLNEKLKTSNEEEGTKIDINPFDFNKLNIANNTNNGNSFNSNNPFESNPFSSSIIGQQKPDSKKEPNAPSAKTLRKLHDAEKDKNFSEGLFPGYFLYVERESFKNKIPDHLRIPDNVRISKDAIGEIETDDETSLLKDIKALKSDPRTEKLSKFLDDDVFQKFQEIVGYNSLQVLRYDFGGKPLYYTDTKKVDLLKIVPKPAFNPSSQRVFEMQLMPKMIIDLENEASFKDGMEWGTILIFTDIENYIPTFDKNAVGYVEEYVKVQWEPRE